MRNIKLLNIYLYIEQTTYPVEDLAPLYNRLFMRKSYLFGLLYAAHGQCAYLPHAKSEFETIAQLLSVKDDPLSIAATIGKGKVVEGGELPFWKRGERERESIVLRQN